MAILCHFLHNPVQERLNDFVIAQQMIIIDDEDKVLGDILESVIDDCGNDRIEIEVFFIEFRESTESQLAKLGKTNL